MKIYSFVRMQFTAAVGIFALLITGSVLRAQSISMSYVTVGNPGNAPDPATGSLYGSVSYAYNIGEYDVTDSQYCTFLNAVDPTGANALALYNTNMTTDAEGGINFDPNGVNGQKFSIKTGYSQMPVVDVDYWDTLRFANYLDNGNTETGAYTLLGGNTDGYGTPTNASTVTKNGGATVWLPSESEWYKAAYYNPQLNGGNGGYYTYATQSNNTPGNVSGSGSNQANYWNGVYSVTQSSSDDPNQNYLTTVGSFTGSASYYGTYDQSGNVYNWSDALVNSQDPVIRGGSWYYAGGAGNVASYTHYNFTPTLANYSVGFPVASSITAVPEPSTWAMMAVGVGALLGFRWHRRS